MSNLRKGIALASVAACLTCGAANAEETGGYAGAFLRLGVGAYPLSVGGALSGATNTIYSMYYNPAGLVSLQSPQLAASYALLSLDRKLGFVGFATATGGPVGGSAVPGEPVRPRAGIGVGWIYAGVDDIDGRDLDGRHTTTLSNSENAFLFAFAIEPFPRLAFGLTGKVLYNRFPGVKEDGGALVSRGFGVDLGAFVLLAEGLTFGFSVQNLNAHYTWNTQDVWEHGSTKTDRFPRGWRAGIAFEPSAKAWSLFLQMEDSEHGDPRWAIGGSYEIGKALQMRAGIRRNRPGIGLGVEQEILGKSFRLNYAFYAGPNAPAPDHWLGWQVGF